VPCTAPVRGKTDAKYPWDPDINNDPCGNPDIYAGTLCKLHWEMQNGQAALSYAQTILTDAPTVWWRLDEASGTVLKDAMGGPDGTYTAGAVKGQPSLVAGGGSAVDLPTTSDYGTIPDSALTSITAAITLEAWCRVKVLPTNAPSLTIYILQKGSGYQIRMDDFGSGAIFSIFLWDPALAVHGASSSAAQGPKVGQVYHVVGTYDGANVCLYLNGALVTTSPWVGTIVDNANGLSVGPGPILIDEVAVYNYALSAARILAHYNAGKSMGIG